MGGIDLAAEWAGFETVGQCEWADYPTRVLEKHWPDVPKWRDIRSVTKESFTERTGLHAVDLVSGGFPCQPFSVAGKQKGKGDNRYLWPEMLRVIRELTPRWVLGENVPGIIKIAGEAVCKDLEREGYAVAIFNYEAAAVGAPHRRERVFFVGERTMENTRDSRCKQSGILSQQQGRTELVRSGENCAIWPPAKMSENVADTIGMWQLQPQRGKQIERGRSCNSSQDVSNACKQGLQRWCQGLEQPAKGRSAAQRVGHDAAGYGCTWWATEPDVGRGFNGFPDWLERHIGRGMTYKESRRSVETLRELWKGITPQAVWKAIGGFDRIQKAEILFSVMRQYQKSPNQTRILLESEEALKGFVRSLWMQEKITGSSYRPRQKEQQSGEYSDAMQALSRLLAHNSQENWQISCWEDGIPRVASGTRNRTHRLKCLGNAVVPQQVYPILAAIAAIEKAK